MLMSSNDYQRLKNLTSRYKPTTSLSKYELNKTPNSDLEGVMNSDIPKHNFMKTVAFGSKSGSRASKKDCMQIVDHEEIVLEENVE